MSNGDYVRKLENLVTHVFELLRIQISLIPNFKLTGGSNELSVGVVGYIYGFTDCAASLADLELNTEIGHAALGEIYKALGAHDVTEILDVLSKGDSNTELSAGIVFGGQQYMSWATSNGEIGSWGLTRYFQG
jgi:hypothetical protein